MSNLFEKAKFEQANRVIQTKSKSKNLLTNKDIENAINMISHTKYEKRVWRCENKSDKCHCKEVEGF